MTTLVIIDTKTVAMRRYEGRKRTHKVTPSDLDNWPLSAAYVPVINEFRLFPERFFPSGPQEAA